MQNNMQIWLESSTTTFNLNSHEDGVYLISDLDGLTSLPSIRTSAGVNAGTDGGWTSAQAFDARLISVRVVIANEDVSVVETKRRQLNSLLAQSRKETLKLHFLSEGGMEYVINVRITNVSGALTNILKKQELLIQMRADDPIIYGSQGGGSADATLNVQQAIGGFEIPFDIPLIIDGGTDKVNVENLGSEEVYPTIKMTGPLHNPTVVNETQDAEIGVNADLGDMEWRGYESLQLLGNTTQTTYAGKNLWGGFSADFSKNVGGITLVTKTDGTITTTAGTSTAAGYSMNTSEATNNGFMIPLKAGTYTLSGGVSQVTLSVSAGGQEYRADAQTGKITFALVSDTTGFVRITIANGATISAQTIKPMLELGSTASPYEPYTGSTSSQIMPSPNPDYPQTVNVVSGEQTVKVVGKNLLNADRPSTTYQGITYTNNGDGSIYFSGVSNQVSSYYVGEQGGIHLKAGQTYTISANNEAINSSVAVRLSKKGGGVFATSYMTSVNKSWQYTPTEDMDCTVEIRVPASFNISSGFTVKPQLELGSTATTYEPYQGQSYEINLGKNLVDIDNISVVNAYVSSTGVETSALTNLLTDYISARPSTYYTLSVDTTMYNLAFAEYDANKTFITRTSISTTAVNTIKTDASTRFIRVSFNRNNTSTITRDYVKSIEPQLEAGSKATSYSPYKTPMELCKIGTYQDYIYKDGGKWYKHAEIGKVVLDGDANINVYNTQNSIIGFRAFTNETIISSPDATPTDGLLSDHYQMTAFNNFYNAQTRTYGTICVASSEISNFYITAPNSTVTTEAQFRTWLSTHNTTVYYVLATPTDTEITDSELVGELDALLETSPYYGTDQNVFLIPSGGAQGTLILGAPNDPKPADVVLIDTQMKTVTFNGQNIYHLLKEGSSFFTLAPGDNSMYLTSDVSSDTGKAEIKFKQGFVSI